MHLQWTADATRATVDDVRKHFEGRIKRRGVKAPTKDKWRLVLDNSDHLTIAPATGYDRLPHGANGSTGSTGDEAAVFVLSRLVR
jgi:hypothetical protein